MKTKKTIKLAKEFKKNLKKAISKIKRGKSISTNGYLTLDNVSQMISYCNAIIGKKMQTAHQIQWGMWPETRAKLPKSLYDRVMTIQNKGTNK